MVKKKLARSPEDRWIAGVCGGIAEYTGLPSWLIRVIAIVLFFVPVPVILVLLPSVWYGNDTCCATEVVHYGDGTYWREYEYPLDSGCLWQEWQKNFQGGYVCNCMPGASCGLPEDNGYVTVVKSITEDEIEASIVVGGETVWTGSAKHGRLPGTGCGMTVYGLKLIDECGECAGCESGDCSQTEHPDMKSMKFRIPLGTPRKGQVSGFVYLSMETPCAISPARRPFSHRLCHAAELWVWSRNAQAVPAIACILSWM